MNPLRDAATRVRRLPTVVKVVLALAGVSVGVLAVGETSRWPGIGGPLQRVFADQTGWVTQARQCRARFVVSPVLDCAHLVIGDKPWLEADDIQLRWRWSDAWRWWRGGGPVLRALGAERLDVRLERDAQGRATWTPPRARGGTGQRDAPVVERLSVRQGHLRWRDAAEDVDLDVTLAARDGDPGYVAHIEGNWRELAMDLDARTPSLLPLLQRRDDGAMRPLHIEGKVGAARVRYDGEASSLWRGRRLNGSIALNGPSLARAGQPLGLTLPQTPPFELKARLAHEDEVWRVEAADARVGGSRLTGDFRYDAAASPGALTGHLHAPLLRLEDLGPSVGTDADPKRPRVLPDRPFDLPSLRAMRAALDVSVARLRVSDGAVAPLSDLKTRLLLADGLLQFEDLQADVSGGRLTGRTSLRALTGRGDAPESATWIADLQLTDVDLSRWITAARTGPDSTSGLDAYLEGRLRADLDVRGQGRSTAELLSTMDGRLDLRVGEGSMSHLLTEAIGFDIAQAVGVAVRGDRALPLRCARLLLGVQDGRATVRSGVIDNADSTLRINGRVFFDDETLALTVKARPKDVSLLSLRVPVTVSGPWLDPRVDVDKSRLAGKVLGAAVLGAVAGPVAALLPLVDPGDKAERPCAEAAAESGGARPAKR